MTGTDSQAIITIDSSADDSGGATAAVGYVYSDAAANGVDQDGLFKVVSTPEGRQFWVKLNEDEDDEDDMMREETRQVGV